MWGLEHLRQISIPKPDDPAWDALAAAFDEVCDLDLLPMKQANECDAHRVIDRAAAQVPGIDEAEVAEWRRKLAREPAISNQPAPDR